MLSKSDKRCNSQTVQHDAPRRLAAVLPNKIHPGSQLLKHRIGAWVRGSLGEVTRFPGLYDASSRGGEHDRRSAHDQRSAVVRGELGFLSRSFGTPPGVLICKGGFQPC